MKQENDEVTKLIIAKVNRKIAGLKRSSRYMDYYETYSFSSNLYDIREDILTISKVNPDIAFDLMLNFLKTGNNSIERCDDSNGSIAGEYGVACENLAQIAVLAGKPATDAVDIIYDFISNDDYNIYMNMISDCKDWLKEEGLSLMKEKVLELLSPAHIKKVVQQEDDEEVVGINLATGEKIFKKSLEISKKESLLWDVRRFLEQIADCRNDVEEYKLAIVYPKTTYTLEDFHDSDKQRIAERLINAERYEEALEYLESIKKREDDRDFYYFYGELTKLKIQALEAVGRKDEAQELRINWFKATLDVDVFNQIVEHTPPESINSFIQEAINHAFNHHEFSSEALIFFVECKLFDKCNEFVLQKLEHINASNYKVVRNTAKELRKHEYFLSAAMLYRKLVDDVADKGNSKYYKYAAKDLYTCMELDNKIDDYGAFESYKDFYAKFAERHKRKYSLWEACERVAQSEADKLANKAKKRQKI